MGATWEKKDMADSLRLATRGSDLALAQANAIAAALRGHGADVQIEVVKTAGDRSGAQRFADIGPQGVFTREIELALVEGRADIAVHSCKDLPTRSADELCLAAVPRRAAANDVLLIRKDALAKHANEPFAPLDRGAKVGTSSERRKAWLKHFRHDIDVVPLRGNVPTRLARLRDADYDAILLAAAGLDRLNAVEDLLGPLLADITVLPLDADTFVPAPAQGALAVQCRLEDKPVRELLEQLDDAASRTCVEVERAALAHAEGGCDVAFGAHCRKTDTGFTVTCMLERNGQVQTIAESAADASGLGAAAWHTLEDAFAGE